MSRLTCALSGVTYVLDSDTVSRSRLPSRGGKRPTDRLASAIGTAPIAGLSVTHRVARLARTSLVDLLGEARAGEG